MAAHIVTKKEVPEGERQKFAARRHADAGLPSSPPVRTVPAYLTKTEEHALLKIICVAVVVLLVLISAGVL